MTDETEKNDPKKERVFGTKYIVVGIDTETGRPMVALEHAYEYLDEASLFDAALSRRDAAAAFAEMKDDEDYRDVTVHHVLMGPALPLEEVNLLFDE